MILVVAVQGGSNPGGTVLVVVVKCTEIHVMNTMY